MTTKVNIRVSEPLLVQLLGLPQGTRLTYVNVSQEERVLTLGVDHPDLPEPKGLTPDAVLHCTRQPRVLTTLEVDGVTLHGRIE